MKFFIGIVPPADIYNTVADIQRKFGDNLIEPHITLRPPVIVKEESSWLKTIRDICFGFSPFNIELPSTGFFGKHVLFINALSETLYKLHYSIIKAVKIYEQPEVNNQEGRKYNPHLTLGRSWCGFTMQDFTEMKEITDTFLSHKEVSFIAHSIRIYYKPLGSNRYSAKEDISLTGSLI